MLGKVQIPPTLGKGRPYPPPRPPTASGLLYPILTDLSRSVHPAPARKHLGRVGDHAILDDFEHFPEGANERSSASEIGDTDAGVDAERAYSRVPRGGMSG